jgi:hypothetical protein
MSSADALGNAQTDTPGLSIRRVQATEESRTLNPRFTKAVLCRLSYSGIPKSYKDAPTGVNAAPGFAARSGGR